MGAKIFKTNRMGQESVILRNDDSDHEAEIVPGIGCNVIRLKLKGREIICTPQDGQELALHPTKYGIPVLSPPNRVKKGQFTFQGKDYQFPQNAGLHHLHGELNALPWTIIDEGQAATAANDDVVFVTCEYRIKHHPHVYDYYPHNLVYLLTYELSADGLKLRGSVVNEGEDESPIGLGFHPYFVFSGQKRENVSVRMQASEEWPIGDDLFVQGESEDSELCQQLRDGLAIEDVPGGDYSLLTVRGERHRCEMIVPGLDTVVYEWGEAFPFVALFKPPWTQKTMISLEPYTCLTDAFNLPFDSLKKGKTSLKPGETLPFDWAIRLEGSQE